MLNNLEDLILTKFRVASHHMSMPRSICDSLVNYTHTHTTLFHHKCGSKENIDN